MGKVYKFPYKADFCFWCWKPVKVKHNFDEKTTSAFCCAGCRDAYYLFGKLYKDEL